ncbi:hypothetical protein A5718_10850 [Mycolicibacterium conceptionense]|nr:hypothetical protein A5718_10850 [Mycolicibacterium conceptionense]OBF47137.1 hypothetical protein A5720_06285 [Mycolicibacterium conceptionense]
MAGRATVANNLGVVQCQLGEFLSMLCNMESAVQYFTGSEQPDRASTTLAAIANFRATAKSHGIQA